MSADMLERVRMCVAEAGYDPTLVNPPRTPGYSFRFMASIPEDVIWRARETALVGEPHCRICFAERITWDAAPLPPRTCLAGHRFVEDCGVAR